MSRRTANCVCVLALALVLAGSSVEEGRAAPAASGEDGAAVRGATQTIPQGLRDLARARVAELWGIAEDRIVMEWGAPSTPISSASPFDLRLIGRGKDGLFTAALQPRDNPATRLLTARIRAGVMDTVIVATRAVNSGELLGCEDMTQEARVVWGPPAKTRYERPREGWEVRRSVAAGEALLWPAVQPPRAIEAGEAVRLFWARGGVRIEVEGVALNSARIGETVRARVAGRRDRLAGTVTAPGSAVLFAGGDR